MNKIIIFIFFNLIISNSYGFEQKKILIIDTGIDLSHDKVKNFKINQEKKIKIVNDHGTHLFCILTNNLNYNKYLFTSINYKKQKIDDIFKVIENKNFDFILFASNGEIYQKKERQLLNHIIKKNKDVKIVTSSGNKGLNLDINKRFPCSYNLKQIICIGNYEKYSNYGSKVTRINSPKKI
jgi:hypothetical protein